MSRTMELKPAPSYRGVVLSIYSHKSSHYNAHLPLNQYSASDGTVYHYQSAVVHGPFATRGRAKAAITTYSVNRDQYGKLYDDRLQEQYTFIEETSSVWTVSS